MNGSAEDSCADVRNPATLKLRFHGHKIVGEFALVRTNRAKGKDWLLIKKKVLCRPRRLADRSRHTQRTARPGDISRPKGAVKAEMPTSFGAQCWRRLEIRAEWN